MQFTYLDKNKLLGNCKKIPVKQLDLSNIRDEINSIDENAWNTQFRSGIHQDTTSIFLKGHPPIDQKPEDSDRSILASLPCIKNFIYNQLPGTPRKCLIARLRPHGVIKMHTDGAGERTEQSALIYDYFKSTIRIHLPIITNDNIFFYITDQFYTMPAGEVWAINNLTEHGVINNDSNIIRVHLIVDIIPDEAQQQSFTSFNEPEGWQNDTAYQQLIS